jgi:hypothetical protein
LLTYLLVILILPVQIECCHQHFPTIKVRRATTLGCKTDLGG